MPTHGRSRVLFIDGLVNIVLGIALLFFDPLAGWLGVMYGPIPVSHLLIGLLGLYLRLR